MARLLKQSGYRATRWKNGGGSTCEVAIFPPNATLDNFDWRISIATIERSGPFSTFQGVDRTLSLLDGDAVHLHFDSKTVVLSAKNPTVSFPGEQAVFAEVRGTTTDFNVMTRRAGCLHRVTRMSFTGTREIARNGSVSLLFMAGGEEASVADAHVIQRFDCLLFNAKDAATCTVQSTGEVTLLLIDLIEESHGKNS